MSTAIEKKADQAEAQVKDLVKGQWDAVVKTLPEFMDPKRFVQLLFNQIRLNPILGEASATSLVGAILNTSQLGLEFGPLGEAYLVPYKRKTRDGREWVEAQLIIGYQGLVKLYRQHPDAGRIDSDFVCEHDDFNFAKGTAPFLTHIPAKGERGKITHYWASYTLRDGSTSFVVLTPKEVAELRGKAPRENDIPDPQHWMERKTVLKQLLKLAPKSTQLGVALKADERDAGEQARVVGTARFVERATQAIQSPDVDIITGEVVELASAQERIATANIEELRAWWDSTDDPETRALIEARVLDLKAEQA